MSLTTVEIEAFSGPALVEIVGSDEPSVVQIESSDQPEIVYINQGPASPNAVIDTTFSNGTANLTVNSESFNLAPTGTNAVGRLRWNDTDGTLDLGLKGGNVTLQIGQEQVIRVVNKTNPLITLTEAAFQAVRVTGAQGQRLKVDLALATSDLGSATTIGIVTETITGNQEGFITTSGVVRGIDTRGTAFGETWADGDVLYLSPLVAGRITNVKPAAPQHTVIIGWVVNATVNGSIFVKVDNGYELQELHNVAIADAGNPLAVNDILTCYDSTSNHGYWKNTPVAEIAVDLISDQTISGVKIFSDQVILDSPTIGDTATLSQLNWNILPDGSGTFASLSTNAGSSNYWSISQTGAAYFKGVLTLSGNFGSSSGRIDFDKDTGSDGSLYPLTLTSFRNWELPDASGTIALDSTAVMLTGTQIVAGQKSFSGQVELTGQSPTNGTSAMTRDLVDKESLFALGVVRPLFILSGNTGTSGSGTSSINDNNGFTLVSGTTASAWQKAAFTRTITGNPASSGACPDFSVPMAIALNGFFFIDSAATSEIKIIIGDSSASTAPVAIGSNVLTARGFGIRVYWSVANARREIKLFCHNGTTYSESATGIAFSAGDVASLQSLIISSSGTGTIKLFYTANTLSNKSGIRTSDTAVLSLSGGPTTLQSGSTFLFATGVTQNAVSPPASQAQFKALNIVLHTGVAY